MKIKFHKAIRGRRNLTGFVSEREALYSRYPERFLTGFDYKLGDLESRSTDEIQKALQGKGFEITPSANYALWSSSPEPFALKLNAKISPEPGNTCKGTFLSDYELRHESKLEKVGEREEEGFWRTRKVPVYQEIPGVLISGTVGFERFEGVEPKPVLEALTGLGYNAEVVPTIQELETALERARAAVKKARSSGGSSTYRSGSGDDGLLGIGVGLLVGSMLGGD
jgi:hypothetical protein